VTSPQTVDADSTYLRNVGILLQPTRRHNPEDLDTKRHCRVNHKTHTVPACLMKHIHMYIQNFNVLPVSVQPQRCAL